MGSSLTTTTLCATTDGRLTTTVDELVVEGVLNELATVVDDDVFADVDPRFFTNNIYSRYSAARAP
jgi:hypothetical protein